MNMGTYRIWFWYTAVSPRVCRSNRVLVFLRSTPTPSIADIDLCANFLAVCLPDPSLD